MERQIQPGADATTPRWCVYLRYQSPTGSTEIAQIIFTNQKPLIRETYFDGSRVIDRERYEEEQGWKQDQLAAETIKTLRKKRNVKKSN